MIQSGMSKERKDLIEVMARAICREYGDPGDYWIAYADLAEAALSALEGAGFVVVPREPEYAQLRAMSESVAVDDEGPFEPLHDLLDFSGENKTYTVLRAAYRAMISAYSPKNGGGA